MARRGSQGDGGDTTGTQRGEEVLETTEVSLNTGRGTRSSAIAPDSCSCGVQMFLLPRLFIVVSPVRKWRGLNYFVFFIQMFTSMYLNKMVLRGKHTHLVSLLQLSNKPVMKYFGFYHT